MSYQENSARKITPAEHQRICTHYINRLFNVFGEPKTNDLEAFVEEYVRGLSGFETQALIEGCDRLFRTIKKEFRVSHWPTINECIEACKHANREIYARNNPLPKPSKDYGDEIRRSFEERRANEMIRGPVAARACREGWIVGLHDFVRDNQRLPTHEEEAQLIDAAEFVRNCAAGNVAMGFMHAGLFTLSQAMLERRSKLEIEFGEAR